MRSTILAPASSDYRGRLTETELMAAVLDGDVVRVGGAYQCIDLPVDAELRGASLRAELAPEHIAIERTAAWIWGGALRLSRPFEVAMTGTASLSTLMPERYAIRRMRPALGDVTRIGGVYATTRMRTIIDLLRSPRPDFDGTVIGRIMAEGAISREHIERDLARRRRLRGRELAWTRLQVLVTR